MCWAPIISTRWTRGTGLAAQDKHAEAEATYRDLLAAEQRVRGADHPDTLITWYQVAVELAAQDKHAEAEAEFRQVRAALQKSLGADHLDTLDTWYQVAVELAAQDKHAEAETEFRQVRAAWERVLGADHLDTLDTWYRVAVELAAQDKHAEAETEFRQVRAARERVLGADHLDTLGTWYRVAVELAAQDKHAEAEATYRDLLAAEQRVRGADHPDTLITWYQVAVELAAQDKHAEAEATYRDLLAAEQRVRGADHPDTLITWYQVAVELAAQDKHAEAEATYRDVLAARERLLGAQHRDTLASRKGLATLLLERGKQLIYSSTHQSTAAEGSNVMTEMEQALAYFKEALGLVDPEKEPGYYGVILHDIGATNKAMGNLQQAAEAYAQAVVYKRKRLPDNPGDLAITMEAYSDLLVEYGELSEARRILGQLRELLPQIQEPARRAVRLHAMGRGFESLGDRGQENAYAEAMAAYKEALGLINSDADPGSYATVLNDMGDVYQVQGKLEEARTAYRQAVDYMRLLPEEKGAIASMLLDLGRIQRRIANLDRTSTKDVADVRQENDAEDACED